jgi:predicted secreted acid phosphatase
MVKDYYKGWPTSGKYYNKLNEIYYLLYNYLINFPRVKNKKYTVIFDIDDTLVYTDHLNLFPNKKFPNNWIRGYMLFPEIPQIVKIIKLCKQLGFKIIIITARPYESEKSSKKNLELLGIEYDEMYHNKNYPDLNFKISLKQKLSKTNNIILSVGDQWPDIKGLNNCLCIKLPSLQDHNAYFTFDNSKHFLI